MPSTTPPQREPTIEKKLLAAVIQLEQQMPGGLQLRVALELKHCIAEVEKLFTEHDLPLREEIVAALTEWLDHAKEGQQYIARYRQSFARVVQHVQSEILKADEKRRRRMRKRRL